MLRLMLLASVMLVPSVSAAEDLVPPAEPPQWIMLSSSAEDRIATVLPVGIRPVTVTQAYTVMVPFVETDANGNRQTKVREEVRTREVTMMKNHDGPETVRWRIKDVKFLDIHGKELDYEADVAKRLATAPVAALSVTEPKVHPFYAEVLKPETLVVVLPAPKARVPADLPPALPKPAGR